MGENRLHFIACQTAVEIMKTNPSSVEYAVKNNQVRNIVTTNLISSTIKKCGLGLEFRDSEVIDEFYNNDTFIKLVEKQLEILLKSINIKY